MLLNIKYFMRYFRISTLLLVATVLILNSSCKNKKRSTTISLESVLTMKVAHISGENINPYTQEEYEFIGSPGAIAYAKHEDVFPFLLIGKDFKKNDSYLCHFIGVISFELNNEKKYMGVALPIEERFKTLRVNSYEELSREHSETKLWISDWLRYAFKQDNVNNIRWSNESEIYRRLSEENKE